MKAIGSAIGFLNQAGAARDPVPPEYVTSLEVAVQASLPQDYRVLLERCGTFEVPGEPVVRLYDPAVVCAYVGSIYNMEGMPPAAWPALPIARYGDSGDDLGFVRTGDVFGPAVGILNHEGPWLDAARENWYEVAADSLSDFILSRRTA